MTQRTAASRGLGPYFSRLEAALEALDAGALRARVREHARRVGEPERRALLASLEATPAPPPVAGDAEAAPDPDKEAERLADEPLLREIDAFVDRLEESHYYQGWGWDPELRDERAWGDESWAEEMDHLFGAAEEAYLSGDLPLAAEAYGALLEAFLLNQDGPVFCGPLPPTEMVETDVGLAKARYFRALYEMSPRERRPAELLAAMEKLRWVGEEEVGLEAVADADAPPLRDFTDFLPAWIELLEAEDDGKGREVRYGWGRRRKWLLREASRLSAGEKGLAALARRRGASDPDAYHDWIGELAGAGRWSEALQAALEGVEAVEEPAERARLADAAAGLARVVGEPGRALEARRRAWRTEPVGRRLLALAAALAETGEGVEGGLQAEVERAGECGLEATERVLGALELLAGRWREAAERLRDAPPLGWSGGGHPGYVVFPFLAVAGSGGEPPAESLLEAFWERMSPELAGWSPRITYLPSRGGVGGEEKGVAGEEEDDRADLGRLLRSSLEGSPPEAAARRRFLEQAESTALARTRAIVSNKHRGAYERAARVAGAAAEAWRLAGEKERSESMLVGLRREFSRYYAFSRELRGAVGGSPVLRPVRPLLE